MATVIESLLVSLGFRTDTRGADEFSRKMQRLEEQAQVFGMFVAAAFSVFTLAKAADEVTLMNDRLTDLAGSAEAAAEMQDKLYESSQRLGVDQNDMSKAAARALPSLKEMGKGVDEAIKLSEILAITARLSGASTDEAAASAQQFSQALGSGVLNGDELKSILENNQALARTLAEQMGVPLGALKGLGEEGKITSKLMADSLLKAYDKVIERSKGLSDTFSMMMLRFKNWFFGVTRQLADAGVFQVFIDGLGGVWQWLEAISSSDAVKNFAVSLTESLRYLAHRLYTIRRAIGAWLDDLGVAEYKAEALSAVVFLLTANLIGLAAAAMRVGVALLMTPIAWLGTALIGLFLILDDFMAYGEGRPSIIGQLIKDYPVIGQIVDALRLLGTTISQIFSSSAGGAGELGASFGALFAALQPVFAAILSMLPTLINLIGFVISLIASGLGGAIGAVLTVFVTVITSIVNLFVGLGEGIGTVVGAGVVEFGKLVDMIKLAWQWWDNLVSKFSIGLPEISMPSMPNLPSLSSIGAKLGLGTVINNNQQTSVTVPTAAAAASIAQAANSSAKDQIRSARSGKLQ